MLDRILHLGLWAAFTVTVTIMLINAFYMLVSPKAWFGLPRWLGLQGVLTLDRHGNRWGALQVRVLGAIIIASVVWIASELLPTIAKR
jgi:hypothetical protein